MNLSVLQWNVWFEEPIENIIEVLTALAPDVICLQELTTGGDRAADRPHRVADALGYALHYTPARAWWKGDVAHGMGNAVLSRFPIGARRSEVIRPPAARPGSWEEGRAYAEATLDTPGGPLTVGTTHLSYVREFTDNDGKDEEVERLLAITGPSPRRYVLTGDFNATPATGAIRRIRDVLTDAGPGADQATWTTKPYANEHDGFRADGLEWRIDYVFVSADLRVVSSRVIDTDRSDHLPLLVGIDVAAT